jgi:hypothetical protein
MISPEIAGLASPISGPGPASGQLSDGEHAGEQSENEVEHRTGPVEATGVAATGSTQGSSGCRDAAFRRLRHVFVRLLNVGKDPKHRATRRGASHPGRWRLLGRLKMGSARKNSIVDIASEFFRLMSSFVSFVSCSAHPRRRIPRNARNKLKSLYSITPPGCRRRRP